MAKSNTFQRYIYKIESKRLRREKWDLRLSLNEAFENDELISISDSQAIRFVYDITNRNMSEEDEFIKKSRTEIKELKREKTSISNKKKIRDLYNNIHNSLFIPEYITVKFDTVSDFNRACKGFFINDIEFKRIVGTSGGIKTNTIVFVSSKIYDELEVKIQNGANQIKLIPAKLEAYRALAFSSSIPVPNTRNVCVVNDWQTYFKSDVTQVGENKNGNLYVQDILNSDISLEDSDGYGAISPRLSEKWAYHLNEDYIPSGYVIRNSYCKGSLFTFDIHDFAENIAKKKNIVDVWGNTHNIEDIDIIMPTSMLKLWNAYDSIEDYLDNCDKNGYSFSITKIIPKELENFRDLNYQFLQSLKLDDDQLLELLKPTIDEIHDILDGDYRKSLLFLRGSDLNEKNVWMKDEYNYVQAMMIDKRMSKDPFVRSHIYRMIKKRIQEAKTGVIRTTGCYQIASGDIYGFMEFAFGMENPKGLLKANEFYSNYWNKKNVNKVAGFRAPMTVHENIKVMNLKNTYSMSYWYRYMKNVIIFNAWDCSSHTLNGLDKDGDTVFSTDSKIILSGIKESFPIVCVQNSAEKIIPTKKQLQDSNKNGFGEKIGVYTNRATTMEQKKVLFEKDSDEYKELEKRIKLCMHFQQAEIDKIKGIKSPPMPKEWYDYKVNKINENDSEDEVLRKQFNTRILANKKPKFMIYIYPDLMKKYKDFNKSVNNNCLMKFKCNYKELLLKIKKTDEEIEFIKRVDMQNPVEECNSLMNKVCNIFENEFDGLVKEKNKSIPFDYTFLSPNVKYSQSRFKKINDLYKEYLSRVKSFILESNRSDFEDEDEINRRRNIMVEKFRMDCYSVCSNEEELLTILLKTIYTTNKSKQFVWDICGELIIRNLLVNNNYNISFPKKCEDGDFVFSYEKYKMKTLNIKEKINGNN